MNPERLVAAHHEIGHAWAYHAHDLPLSTISIIEHPSGGVSGLCEPPGPRRVDVVAYAVISACGPIAEAIWCQQAADDLDALGWDDYLAGAVLAGGHDDVKSTMGMLDDPSSVDYLRSRLTASWPAVTALAHRLAAAGSISGPDAFAQLGETRP